MFVKVLSIELVDSPCKFRTLRLQGIVHVLDERARRAMQLQTDADNILQEAILETTFLHTKADQLENSREYTGSFIIARVPAYCV